MDKLCRVCKKNCGNVHIQSTYKLWLANIPEWAKYVITILIYRINPCTSSWCIVLVNTDISLHHFMSWLHSRMFLLTIAILFTQEDIWNLFSVINFLQKVQNKCATALEKYSVASGFPYCNMTPGFFNSLACLPFAEKLKVYDGNMFVTLRLTQFTKKYFIKKFLHLDMSVQISFDTRSNNFVNNIATVNL